MKIARWIGLVAGVLILGIAALAYFMGPVSNLNCGEIADEAKRISQNEPVQIRNFTDLQETSRTTGEAGEARCTGQAELSNGGTQTVYLRAYEEGSNVMVAYSPTPFE